jgi:hypothetical protein
MAAFFAGQAKFNKKFREICIVDRTPLSRLSQYLIQQEQVRATANP